MFWGVSVLKCFVFQKTVFSRFLIDWTCCSTDQKCDKKLGLNLPGSIGVGSIQHDFRLIESIFSTDQKSVREFFKRLFSRDSSHCSFFFKSFLSLLLGLIHLKSIFVIFFLIFLKGFCLQVLIRPYYPFFFILFTFFMHLRWNFRTYGFLGFLIFELISFKIDHWFLFLDVINMFPMH